MKTYKIMEKNQTRLQFAERLKTTLLNKGHESIRSTSGVDIHFLTEITGYSSQICRKYLRGEAIPEPQKLLEISKHLGVSPGWLLFGEESPLSTDAKMVIIPKSILENILSHICKNTLKPERADVHTMIEFITTMAEMKATAEEVQKILPLAFPVAKACDSEALVDEI